MKKPIQLNRQMSVLEVAVAAGISAVIFGAFFSLISICATAAEHSINTIAADVEADRNVDRLVREVQVAVSDKILEPIPDSTSTVLIYQKQVGFDDTSDPPTLILSQPFEIRRLQEPPTKKADGSTAQEVLDNNQDDDGDGIIDEGIVAIRQSGFNVDILNNVTKLEFRRDRKPSINILMEKAIPDPLDRDPVTNKPNIRFITVARRVFIANNQPLRSSETQE